MESVILSCVAHLPLFIFFFLFVHLIYRWFHLPALRARTEWHLTATVGCAIFLVVSHPVLPILTRLFSIRYDLYAYRLDLLLGYRDFWMGQFILGHSWTFVVIDVAYNLIVSIVLAVFAYYIYAGSLEDLQIFLKTMAYNFVLAIPLYIMIPVSGPRYAFPTFPNLPAAPVVAHLIPIDSPPNGIPSVHMSTALLVLWFLRRSFWGRIAGLIYVFLTIVSTLGGGEHYLIDLICAVPYTALLIYLGCANHRNRIVPESAELETTVID